MRYIHKQYTKLNLAVHANFTALWLQHGSKHEQSSSGAGVVSTDHLVVNGAWHGCIDRYVGMGILL